MFYRIQDAAHNVEDLLTPELQFSISYSSDEARDGISVCDSLEALAAYLAQAGVPFSTDSVVVTLDGTWSKDTPEDEDLGEQLVHPTRIIDIEPMTARLADLIDEACETLNLGF